MTTDTASSVGTIASRRRTRYDRMAPRYFVTHHSSAFQNSL
jgi:hypothetical protein